MIFCERPHSGMRIEASAIVEAEGEKPLALCPWDLGRYVSAWHGGDRRPFTVRGVER